MVATIHINEANNIKKRIPMEDMMPPRNLWFTTHKPMVYDQQIYGLYLEKRCLSSHFVLKNILSSRKKLYICNKLHEKEDDKTVSVAACLPRISVDGLCADAPI